MVLVVNDETNNLFTLIGVGTNVSSICQREFHGSGSGGIVENIKKSKAVVNLLGRVQTKNARLADSQ